MFFLIKLSKIANFGAELERKSQENKKRRKIEKLERQRASDDRKNADFYNDEYFNADNGMSELEIPELGIFEMKENIGSAHILRETVIKNDFEEENEIETDKIEIETSAPKKNIFVNIDLDDEPEFVRSENSEGFRSDDIVYEPVVQSESMEEEEAVEEETQQSIKETPRDFGIDDSADAVFTSDFDPFDIALNERRAEKLSSKAAEMPKFEKSFSEFIPDMTPEQAEQKRRLEEFEANRKRALERRAAMEAEAAEAQTAQATQTAQETKESSSKENHISDGESRIAESSDDESLVHLL